jgi:hypothetical protein
MPDILTAELPEVQRATFKELIVQPSLTLGRYLLFDAVESASLHEQQATLLFFLDLAMTLGRTLVLPRCRLRRLLANGTPSAEADYAPWSELFDLGRLSTVHPAIPIESFLAAHGRVDLLVLAAPETCISTPGATFEQTINGLTAVPVMRSECGVARTPAALHPLSHAAIGFVGSADFLEPGRAAQLRPHVRFERSVYGEAAAFVTERFQGQAYVAVHWSLAPSYATLDGGTAAAVPQSAHDVARHSRRLMKRHGVRKAFLATDALERAELAQVYAKLQPVRYMRVVGDHTLRDLVRRDHVEIAICAMADYFLGTHASRFTEFVLEERANTFGLDAATANEMDNNHNSTVAPSDGRKPQARHLKDEL